MPPFNNSEYTIPATSYVLLKNCCYYALRAQPNCFLAQPAPYNCYFHMF